MSILKRVPEGQHQIAALRRGNSKLFLVWEGNIKIRDVAEFYYQDTGVQVNTDDVSITDATNKRQRLTAGQASSLTVTPRMKELEFHELAHTAG